MKALIINNAVKLVKALIINNAVKLLKALIINNAVKLLNALIGKFMYQKASILWQLNILVPYLSTISLMFLLSFIVSSLPLQYNENAYDCRLLLLKNY